MINVLFYSILLLDLSLINYSMAAPIVHEDKTIQKQLETKTNQSNVQQCQRSMTYDEIRDLLAHSPCISNNESEIRTKRNDDPTYTSNVYALQSTINDHRTIIDDHRAMINYLMNNTINITQLNQHYAEQHINRTPLWKSWRDVSLLLLMFICFCAIVYALAIRFHPLDTLTSILLRRHQNKQQNKTINKKASIRHNHMDLQPPMVSTIPISTIQRSYMHESDDSNSAC